MNLLLARVANRKIDSGHHIRYQNNYYLPTEGSEDQYFTRGSKALVIESFNGEIYKISLKNIHNKETERT